MSHSNALDTWLSGLKLRLGTFKRDSLFELTATQGREWWATQLEHAEHAAARIEAILASAKKNEIGSWVLGSPGFAGFFSHPLFRKRKREYRPGPDSI